MTIDYKVIGELCILNLPENIFEKGNSSALLEKINESFLKKGSPPAAPREVELTLRSSWLERYFLTKDNGRIVKYDKKGGPADWFFIKKK